MLRTRFMSAVSTGTNGKARLSWLGGPIVYHLVVVLIGVISIGGLITLRATDPFAVREARQTAFDLLQRASPRAYIDTPIKIIDINERSLEQLGQWPWPRDRLAEMVDRLHAVGAAAVAFDFLFVEADRMTPNQSVQSSQIGENQELDKETLPGDRIDNDTIFADALKRGNVVLGFGPT